MRSLSYSYLYVKIVVFVSAYNLNIRNTLAVKTVILVQALLKQEFVSTFTIYTDQSDSLNIFNLEANMFSDSHTYFLLLT